MPPLRAAVSARARLAGPPAGRLHAPDTPREAIDAKPRPHAPYLWAMLLARIYEGVPRCGEPMRLIAFITDSGLTTRTLTYLGEPAQAPRFAPAARGPRAGRRTSILAKTLTRP